MASVNLKLGRPSKITGICPVEFKLVHESRHRPIQTKIKVQPEQWSNNRVVNHRNAAIFNQKITNQQKIIQDIIAEMVDVQISIGALKSKILFALDRKNAPIVSTLDELCTCQCKIKRSMNKAGVARTYETGVNSFKAYHGSDILLYELTQAKLVDYKNHVLISGAKKNTVSAYLRSLRALWNAGAAAGYLNKKNYPFKDRLIPGRQRTKKKAIDSLPIQVIEEHAPTYSGHTRLALDIALLQFYLRGMSFIDVIMVRPEHIVRGYIEGERYKNRGLDNPTPFRVKIIRKAQAIFDRYKGGKYLVDVLDNIDLETPYKDLLIRFNGDESKTQEFIATEYERFMNKRSALYRSVNKVLKALNRPEKISGGTMRHTWITIAYRYTDRFQLVQYAAAHTVETETQTDTYMLYDQAEIDRINELVCNHVPMKVIKKKKAA